jgi:hypothetical protein
VASIPSTSSADAFLRSKRANRPLVDPPKSNEEKRAPLVTQGARSRGRPWLQKKTVDDAIREARGRGLWREIL